MKRDIMEEIIDLKNLSAILLMMYCDFDNDAIELSNESLAEAIDGVRRGIIRVTESLESVENDYDLIPRTKGVVVS